MLWTITSLGEYLSLNMRPEDIVFVDKILNEWPGCCIWMNVGGKCYFNSYTLPKYLIKEIDKDNSRLIVYPITAKEVEHERTYDGDWTTFDFTVEKKTKSLKLGLIHTGQVKIGSSYVNVADIRKTDLNSMGTRKNLTRMNVWD